MKLLGKCESCKKKKFFVRKRTFTARGINQPITSKGDLCGGCTKKIKKLVA